MDKLAEYEAKMLQSTDATWRASPFQPEEPQRCKGKLTEETFAKFSTEYETIVSKYHLLVKKSKRLEKELESIRALRHTEHSRPNGDCGLMLHSLENNLQTFTADSLNENFPYNADITLTLEAETLSYSPKGTNKRTLASHPDTKISGPSLSVDFRRAILSLPLESIRSALNSN